ncbi:TOM7 family-domain-containing protein [Lipomyces japonicus]|uniref:TOM7 family-domain-containing protein n=1 Tax=Lipomyces japonicus TaxID=56871 RepID=UPI0034CF85D3
MAYTLSEESKERLVRIHEAVQVTFRYGLVPLVVYLGWSQSPGLSLIDIVSPFSPNA